MAALANLMNIAIYHTPFLNGETFNMFYISPYFKPELPVFDAIYENAPYLVFLFSYILAIILGSYIVQALSEWLKKIHPKRVIMRSTNAGNREQAKGKRYCCRVSICKTRQKKLIPVWEDTFARK